MTDKDILISDLNDISEILNNNGYGGWCATIRKAVVMLKEQEAFEPVDDGHGSLICGNQGCECGCVGRYDLATKAVEKYCNFCPECGRKVKWE